MTANTEVHYSSPTPKTSIPNSSLVVRQINEIREVIRRMKVASGEIVLDPVFSEKLQKAAES